MSEATNSGATAKVEIKDGRLHVEAVGNSLSEVLAAISLAYLKLSE